MDLLHIIRLEINTIPDGPTKTGLQSVLHHIEVAYRHLARGQDNDDDSAFTDAIYRTNQAFEGSIKEAYRVLAGQDPAGQTPFKIEKYLEENQVFKDRVLAQLKNYRREWRNPSAHDYNLYFDEAEAFLAIVSVSAFAKLLIDQISEKISFDASQGVAEEIAKEQPANAVSASNSLLDQVKVLVQNFMARSEDFAPSAGNRRTESQLLASIAGYLSTVAPDIKVAMEQPVGESRARVDLAFSRGDQRVFLEAKRWRPGVTWRDTGLIQLHSYMEEEGVIEGILLLYDSLGKEYIVEVAVSSAGMIYVISPKADAQNAEE